MSVAPARLASIYPLLGAMGDQLDESARGHFLAELGSAVGKATPDNIGPVLWVIERWYRSAQMRRNPEFMARLEQAIPKEPKTSQELRTDLGL